jgi:hypothetical protein
MAKSLEAALRSRGLVPLHGAERPATSPFLNLVSEDAWALVSDPVGAPYKNAAQAVAYRPFTDPPINAWLALVWNSDPPALVHRLANVARSLGLTAEE